MKKIIYIISILMLFMTVSCEENESLLQTNDFSDVSFINSQIITIYDMNALEVNNPIAFKDLSQGTVNHKWIIDTTCVFISGEYTSNDSIYTDYIISDIGVESEEATVNVLFQKAGTHSVELYNTFKDSVYYYGLSEKSQDWADAHAAFEGDYSKASYFDDDLGLWVLDTTIVFRIYDKVNMSIDVLNDKDTVTNVNFDTYPILLDADSWPSVSIGVGDTLLFETIAKGDPTIFDWKLANALDTLSDTKIIDTLSLDPIIVKYTIGVQATNMGTYNAGQLKLTRTDGSENNGGSDTRPAGTNTKYIPLKVIVTAPTTPLKISDAKLTNFTTMELSVPIELSALPSDVTDLFTLSVSNEEKSFDSEIAISQVILDNEEGTLTLNLADSVYSDDEVKLSYTGTTITDIYGRSLEMFTDVAPTYFKSVITNSTQCGFEGTITDDKNIDGWYIQHYPAWSLSSEKSHEGSYSMKYDSDLKATNSNQSLQSSTTEMLIDGSAGIYKVEFYIWIEEGRNPNALSFNVSNPWIPNTIDLSSIETGSWQKVELEINSTEDFVPGSTKFTFKMSKNNEGKFYIDDLYVYKNTTRP